jgi:hypothetical protein
LLILPAAERGIKAATGHPSLRSAYHYQVRSE